MLNSHGSWCASEKSLASGVKRDYGFEPDQIAWLDALGEKIEKEYGKIPSFACFHTATVDLIEVLEKKGVYDRQTRFKTECFKPYKWEKNGDLLILKGDNTGMVKRAFSDTMKIESLTKTELTLSQGKYAVSYIKK